MKVYLLFPKLDYVRALITPVFVSLLICQFGCEEFCPATSQYFFTAEGSLLCKQISAAFFKH